jgi:ATP-dependent DNA ligase
VAGYTAGSGARSSTFGALVLTKNGKFVGCVGSGFNGWELRQIKGKLDAASRIPRPFEIDEPWTAVDAKLQVIVKYYKHTENGVMRFPVFEELAET